MGGLSPGPAGSKQNEIRNPIFDPIQIQKQPFSFCFWRLALHWFRTPMVTTDHKFHCYILWILIQVLVCNCCVEFSLLFFLWLVTGTEEGQGSTSVVKAGEIRRREAEEEEMEQGKAKGESQQHGPVWPSFLRQASLRSSQVQAHHSIHPLWPFEGTKQSHLNIIISIFLYSFRSAMRVAYGVLKTWTTKQLSTP